MTTAVRVEHDSMGALEVPMNASWGAPVHANDHVNMSQSSNVVVPTAGHLAAALALEEQRLPALERLSEVLGQRARELGDVVKTGRTHLSAGSSG
jgi:fumarate hydratase class II